MTKTKKGNLRDLIAINKIKRVVYYSPHQWLCFAGTEYWPTHFSSPLRSSKLEFRTFWSVCATRIVFLSLSANVSKNQQPTSVLSSSSLPTNFKFRTLNNLKSSANLTRFTNIFSYPNIWLFQCPNMYNYRFSLAFFKFYM